MATILVVFAIILFIVAELVVHRIRARRAQPTRIPQPGAAAAMELLVLCLQPEHFTLPGGLFFHRGHAWVNLLFSGQVKVGVDDFLQRLLGRIDALLLPPVGVEVKEGQPFVTIRQGSRRATVPAPVDGVVCAVNGELEKAPGLLKQGPYTRGWLVALRPTNLTANLVELKVGESAMTWLREELARLKEFMQVTLSLRREALVGATVANGGFVADGLLEHLDDEAWNTFQREFIVPGAWDGEHGFYFAA